MECKDLLYDLDELLKHKECFLGEEHYYRARLALSLLNKKIKIDESYVIIYTHNLVTYTVYVFGVDDSGKIFVAQVNYPLDFFDVYNFSARKILRFKYHLHEVEKIEDGMSIRIQGDLVLTVEKTFNTYDEMANYIFTNIFSYRVLWDEFMREYLGDEMRIAETLSPIYIDFLNEYDRRLLYDYNEEEIKKIKDTMKEIRRKLKKKYKTFFVDEESIRRVVTHRNKEKFMEFLKGKIEKLTIKLGNYTSPHIVKVTGIFIDNLGSRVALVSPEITVSHKEHGVTKVKIDKFAIVSFQTL